VYTKQAGGYEGVVIWSSYESQAAFEKAEAELPEEVRSKRRVLEQGISKERAIELVHQTPAACRIAAAMQDSRGADGIINPDLLQMELGKAMFANANR